MFLIFEWTNAALILKLNIGLKRDKFLIFFKGHTMAMKRQKGSTSQIQHSRTKFSAHHTKVLNIARLMNLIMTEKCLQSDKPNNFFNLT